MYGHDFTETLFDARDVLVVGGKAVNLGRLIRAGFPVPGGFVVNTRAYGVARDQALAGEGARGAPDAGDLELPPEVAEEIRTAYRAMGAGTVAVRSSATAEDMGHASMAGQYETYLDIEGEAALLAAVGRCWASLHSVRTRAYLHEHKIDPARVAMAVVVQRLVSADAAGVLFTENPTGIGGGEMILEASWGLGESVVSGRVQPDVLRLERDTGRVLSAVIADKRVQLAAGAHAEREVEEARRREPCLKGRDVHRLWQLGTRAAHYFGAPQDIEWAIHGGEVYLLQSRPITTRQNAEAYEEVLRTTRQQLRQELALGRGPWALHNLAETLPHPTPLTWSVMQRFMSGSGGFGAMYRAAGFEPSALVREQGFLERIGGRIYMDAARAPEMFFEKFPFTFDLEELKRTPDASQSPPTLPKGTPAERASAGRRLAAVGRKLRAMSARLDRDLRDGDFPSLVEYVTAAKARPLQTLGTAELIDLWHAHEKRVLEEFAPRSLMPSLVSGMALGELRAFLAENFWEEKWGDVDALAQTISSGGLANRTLLANAELHGVGRGDRSLESWLTDHGHRAPGEFDLAAPRWREQSAQAHELAARMATGDSGPMDRHRRNGEDVSARVEQLKAHLPAAQRRAFDERVSLIRRYVAFREDGKDFLMLGYDLLRDVALEIGRRLDVGPDVFYLTREDMIDALRVGFAPLHLIEQRKRLYLAEEQLALPRVIDAARIESLGATAPVKAPVGGQKAFAVSGGRARGPARILKSPTEAGNLGKGYVLVCPSTDPSWTPLFVNAAALVLECGGSLSHGAVVAREMGLPAVVLPDATRLFTEGEEIEVDGTRAWVGRAAEVALDAPALPAPVVAADPNDLHIAAVLLPPAEGPKDRFAARLRNLGALVWTLFLMAFFLLPRGSVYDPCLRIIDFFLWPAVRALGKPAVVVVVAAVIALATLLLQKLLTDNRRLLEAKRRAVLLKKQASALPVDAPRRAALLRAAAPVQFRTLLAAFVPIGLLLGPMVMPFVWFKERIDPAVQGAPAGSPVQIMATIDSSYLQPVQLAAPADLLLSQKTPAAQSIPALRPTLERLLALYLQPRPAAPGTPWEVQLAPDLARQMTADDLRAYLDAGIPPQTLSWQLTPSPAAAAAGDRYPMTVAAGEGAPVNIDVVLGDRYPPSLSTAAGSPGSPIKEIHVVYPRPEGNRTFLAVGGFDVGWLWVYIIAYLPMVLVLRMLLRVA